MMIMMIPVAAAIALLIGYVVDRIQVGGSGVWYGNDEPPEGFVGFWDRGATVVQWPKPARVEDLTVTDAVYGDIVVSEINAGSIQAQSVSSEDMIADPDFPGMITTKQELARRREMEK